MPEFLPTLSCPLQLRCKKKTLNNNKCLRGNQQREVHEPTTKLFRELMLSEFEEKIVIRV